MFLLKQIYILLFLVCLSASLFAFPKQYGSSFIEQNITSKPRNPGVSRKSIRKRKKIKRQRKRRMIKRNIDRHIRTIKTRKKVKERKKKALKRQKEVAKKQKEALKERNKKKI